ISLRLSTGLALLDNSHSNQTLRAVGANHYLSIPSQTYRFSRLSETTIKVEFDKPFNFVIWEGQQPVEKTIGEFIIEDKPKTIDRFIRYREGTYTSLRGHKLAAVRQFVQAMQSDGISTQLARWAIGTFPLPIYQLQSMSFHIEVDRILEGESLKLPNIRYTAQRVVPGFISQKVETTYVTWSRIGRVINFESPLIQRYVVALQEFRERLMVFKSRGWDRGLERQNQGEVDLEGRPSHIIPIPRRCSRVFLN
ncbi:MAG: hypothetical protein HRT44_03625, partial [Bdellovibrionales bacterium]|nr:hypothetical protein [Bdellovibrionales bacterium]NQZ18333.1 hypothetical protein [Bdellovibrionales bacterium]